VDRGENYEEAHLDPNMFEEGGERGRNVGYKIHLLFSAVLSYSFSTVVSSIHRGKNQKDEQE